MFIYEPSKKKINLLNNYYLGELGSRNNGGDILNSTQ